jgi:hypothetical protein
MSAEPTLFLESLHPVTATTAWAKTTMPDGTHEYWLTALLRSTDGGAGCWEVTPSIAEPLTQEMGAVFFLGFDIAWVLTSAEPADTGAQSFSAVWRARPMDQREGTSRPTQRGGKHGPVEA